MSNTERFEKNLARWALMCPEGAAIVGDTICDRVSICEEPKGKRNLKSEGPGESFYYHSIENPKSEAEEWFARLNLEEVSVLYVYGAGLGYGFEAAREWLRADENRSLVFLEDDPQVISCLLQSEEGTRLVNDRQVFLYYFSKKLFPERPGEKIIGLDSIAKIFSLYPFALSALPAYVQHQFQRVAEVRALISFFSNIHKWNILEYANSGRVFFNNFFRDYLLLPRAYRGDGLYGQFTGVPAIICGAGPSLDNNVDLLATLHDRALIFAGGTAMNALNAKGILPHFGVGIDPNPEQFTRLVMNQAYETPFFYRNRMLHQALKMIHGDKLCIAGSSGYEIAGWLEKKLGIEAAPIEEGNNVLNFSLSIAQAMGCNPIILVGVDLAYSQGKSYASGIISHPIHDRLRHFTTKSPSDELLLKKDIYGVPVETLWKWVGESTWYSHFAREHPRLFIVNATEGGIGFAGIENMTLAEVAKKYLTKQYDLGTRVHGETQNSRMPKEVTESKIKELMRSLQTSLNRCKKKYEEIIEDLEKLSSQSSSQEIDKIYSTGVVEKEKEAAAEEAYDVLLKGFNDASFSYYGLELLKLKCEEGLLPEHEIVLKHIDLDLKRYVILNDTASLNVSWIDAICQENDELEDHIAKWCKQEEKGHLKELRKKYPLPEPSEKDIYSFDSQSFTLTDPEMDLNYTERLKEGSSTQNEQIHYPTGSLKVEQHLQDGLLHGPSTFFSEDGKVLARSWYINGKQEGKMWTFHASGDLHSLQRYRRGQKQGKQEYFYRNGLPKTIMSYDNDRLNGMVSLFYPSGHTERELRFVDGKRYGTERIWNENGQLFIEAQFLGDRPVGTARKWYANGTLACEITYDNNSRRSSTKTWKENGELLSEEEQSAYIDAVTHYTSQLTASLGNVFTHMSNVVEQFSHEKTAIKEADVVSQEFKQDLNELKAEMEHLQLLNNALGMQMEKDKNTLTEDVWTDSAKKVLDQQLSEKYKQMSEEMMSLEKGLKNVFNDLLKKMDQPPDDSKKDKGDNNPNEH